MNATIIPFGKYRGQSVENVAETDPQYVDWLAKQDWMRSKCPTLYQVIINNFCEPSETPEHNEMQARFLDASFRVEVAKAVLARYAASRSDCAMELDGIGEGILFEDAGADVQLCIRVKTTNSIEEETKSLLDCDSPYRYQKAEEIAIMAAENFKRSPFFVRKKTLRIEIKPQIGDDYPAVLRQMQRSKCQILFVRNFSGSGVDEKTFVSFFLSQKIVVIFERDVISAREDVKLGNPVPAVPSSVPGFLEKPGTNYHVDL